MMRCCFNWKVWTGVGVGVLGVLLVAPGAFRAVLPLAFGLACPLSMGAMMWSMRPRGARVSDKPGSAVDAQERIATLQAEIAELSARQSETVGSAEHPPAGAHAATGVATTDAHQLSPAR